MTADTTARSRFRLLVALAALVLALGLWLSSGTLAPYALTTTPLQTPGCGYLYNGDHNHFLATFRMLSFEKPDQWAWSVVLRRVLFPTLAFPFMKILGFEAGGFLASLLLHLAVFLVFVRFIARRYGARAGVIAAWLLATYPGVGYWGGLPYSYAIIMPASLCSLLLLWELEKAETRGDIFRLGIGLGILFTGYDIFPFFGLPALALLVLRRRFRELVPFGALLIAPTLAVMLVQRRLGAGLLNSNTETYVNVLSAYLRRPDFGEWLKLLARVPGDAARSFLRSNFTFLPLLFAIAWPTLRLRCGEKLSRVETLVLAAAALVFLMNNLAPPYQGAWQFRGYWISRIYQPVFVVYVSYLSRALGRFLEAGTPRAPRVGAAALLSATVLANAVVIFSPVLEWRAPATIYAEFYQGTADAMLENLKKFGRRPVGFCQPQSAHPAP